MTNPAPAIAPYVPFYATRTPYLTLDEFVAAPTGVDLSQLVPGGNKAANTAALQTLIAAASNYADSLCYQVLAATEDMESGEYRIRSDGTIRVPVAYTPLIAVTGVSFGYAARALQAMTDLSGLWLSRKTVRVPIAGVATPGPALVPPVNIAQRGCLFAQVTYINGYLNSTLDADVAAAATQITLASPLGAFPGMPLTIYDDANQTTELVTVSPTYRPGDPAVTLTTGLANGHKAGVAVSAFPRAIKQAVICLTAHLVKTRGAESVAFSSMSGGPANVEKEMPGSTEEYAQAVDLLHPFKRVM